jgi:hypothetical protein
MRCSAGVVAIQLSRTTSPCHAQEEELRVYMIVQSQFSSDGRMVLHYNVFPLPHCVFTKPGIPGYRSSPTLSATVYLLLLPSLLMFFVGFYRLLLK